MKIKITLISFCFIIASNFGFAQKKDSPKSIISSKVQIKKYHNISELEQFPKGELLNLYIERVQVLSNIIPYLAFATKPGVTMASLGIPETNENTKALDSQVNNSEEYMENTVDFQKVILPYSDTKNLAKAILFYEDIMKSLHNYDNLY